MSKALSDAEILTEVEKTCRIVFEDPNLIITVNSNAGEVRNWDSMTNLILIDELEKRFDMKFSLDDILEAQNIGELCNIIKQKMN